MKRSLTLAFMTTVLLALGCRKEEPATATSATDTSATTTTVASSTMQTNQENRKATQLTIAFEGLITHVLGGGVTRAVVPRIPNHKPIMIVSDKLKADVEKIFPKACGGGSCTINIDEVAFRVVDSAGNPSSKVFDSTQNFKDHVTHLSKIPADSENPFEKATDLIDGVFSPGPPANSAVAGFVELVGGKGDSSKFGCHARFANEPDFKRFFPRETVVVYNMANGAILQVLTKGQTDWTKAGKINLPPGILRFTVKNDLPSAPNKTHFPHNMVLSKKQKDSKDKPITLPNVEVKPGEEGICGEGGVPGCSNSQFP